MEIIGRKQEINKLEMAYNSNQSEFIAIYGRRRIGKTFLITGLFKYRLLFNFTGIPKAKTQQTLSLFSKAIKSNEKIHNWFDAFEELKNLVEKSTLKKKVIFLDELPWLDTIHSNFLQAISFFWNNFCSHRDDILLIVSGSSTSWIKNKIINDVGGLYNRLTRQIHLLPFSLSECKEFLEYKNINLSKYEIIRVYMIFGGIPHYLNLLDGTLSVADNIDYLFFHESAELKGEHENLFSSIFKNVDLYIDTINAIASQFHGLTRIQILKIVKKTDNGHFTTVLKDLENNGFIKKYYAFPDNKKEAIYQINDNFILFYHSFLIKNDIKSETFWRDNQQFPSLNAWRGLAFELVCLQHLNQIKKALGIIGISSTVSSYQNADCQIDLLFKRADKVINLCEIKFCKEEFEIDKDYNQKLFKKISEITKVSKDRFSINLTMITTFGVKKNKYYSTVINEVIAKDLFN